MIAKNTVAIIESKKVSIFVYIAVSLQFNAKEPWD